MNQEQKQNNSTINKQDGMASTEFGNYMGNYIKLIMTIKSHKCNVKFLTLKEKRNIKYKTINWVYKLGAEKYELKCSCIFILFGRYKDVD